MQATAAGVTFIALPRPGQFYSDFTGATQVQLVTLGPDGVRRAFDMSIAMDGSQATYVTGSGDFPIPGLYEAQVIATYGSGAVVPSDKVAIYVGSNL